MKPNKLCTILMLIALAIAPSFTVYSQAKDSSTVTTDQTIAFLLNQNKEAKNVIGVQEKRISDLEAELAAEKEISASVSKSYEAAKTEISALKSSNEALSGAVAINEQTIELLKADNEKQRDKAKRANKAKWKAYAVAAAAVGLKLLLP